MNPIASWGCLDSSKSINTNFLPHPTEPSQSWVISGRFTGSMSMEKTQVDTGK